MRPNLRINRPVARRGSLDASGGRPPLGIIRSKCEGPQRVRSEPQWNERFGDAAVRRF